MGDYSKARIIAEKYLQEMLEADDTENFDLYIKRFESEYIQGFTEEVFNSDVEKMQQRNGMHKSSEFLGTLRNEIVDGLDIYRTAWKGIYEKRDAIIEMGVYKKNDNWYVLRSAVH